MQKWEYTSSAAIYDEEKEIWLFEGLGNKYEILDNMLNAMGEVGWELVSTSPYASTTFPITSKGFVATNQEFFYFKRPKE